jgi:hypothetical protein
MQQTLLSSCAHAATAAEARFRINAKQQPARHTRVVALDQAAGAVVRPLVGMPWRDTRFLRYDADRADVVPAPSDGIATAGVPAADIMLVGFDGSPVRLSAELADADFVMMVATSNDAAAAASSIGLACARRSIMTASVVLGVGHAVDSTVTALRPYSRVLLVSRDEQDVAEILSVVAS